MNVNKIKLNYENISVINYFYYLYYTSYYINFIYKLINFSLLSRLQFVCAGNRMLYIDLSCTFKQLHLVQPNISIMITTPLLWNGDIVHKMK